MARLSSGDTILEIRYNDFFAGWVMYEIDDLNREEKGGDWKPMEV